MAHFQSPGTWPVVNDWLNINCRKGAISSAASLSTKHEMPSGPLAFFALIFLSRDTMPLVWNTSGSISETPLLSISGIVSTSSSVKTALNWLLRISASALLSVISVFPEFKELMPTLSFIWTWCRSKLSFQWMVNSSCLTSQEDLVHMSLCATSRLHFQVFRSSLNFLQCCGFCVVINSLFSPRQS